MKIDLMSDLHLEFEPGEEHTVRLGEGDLLILAGDTYLPARCVVPTGPYADGRFERRHEALVQDFFKDVSERYGRVLIVPGNHEHYNGVVADTVPDMRAHTSAFGNIRVLDNETEVIDGICFFGSTFWTDMKGRDPLVMLSANNGMNDFYKVMYKEGRVYNAEQSVAENDFARERLFEFLTKCEDETLMPFVITHHAPSERCVLHEYRGQVLNFAYANTGLDDILDDEHLPLIWVHGHMHKRDKIECAGGSLILCNARGYIGEAYGGDRDYEPMTFEVNVE